MWKSNIERKYQHCRSISIDKVINLLMYNGNIKPDGISQPRWDAIVKHIRREYNV